jgi:hypothetical protein
MSGSAGGTRERQRAFEIKGADGSTIAIDSGEYYINTKARCRRKMLNSLSPEARRIDACLELGTMGFLQELAVEMESGKRRPMVPGDIARKTGLSKQHVRRGLEELENAGLAERRSDDGGPLRHGHVLIYSFAVPREQKKTESSQRAATLPPWFPESWESLKPLIKRLRLSLSTDEGLARGYFEEIAEAARGYQKAEKVAVELLKRVCAQPEKPPLNKEERNERTFERKSFSSSSSSSAEAARLDQTTTTETPPPEKAKRQTEEDPIDEAMVAAFGVALDAPAKRRLWQNCRAKRRHCTEEDIVSAIRAVGKKAKGSRVDSPPAYVWEAVPNELEAISRGESLARRRASAAGAANEPQKSTEPVDEAAELKNRIRLAEEWLQRNPPDALDVARTAHRRDVKARLAEYQEQLNGILRRRDREIAEGTTA